MTNSKAILKNNHLLLSANKNIAFQLTFMAYYLWIHQWEALTYRPTINTKLHSVVDRGKPLSLRFTNLAALGARTAASRCPYGSRTLPHWARGQRQAAVPTVQIVSLNANWYKNNVRK